MSLLKRALTNPAPVALPATKPVAKQPVSTPAPRVEAAPVKDREIRLAVCVPCKDMMHSTFSHNLHSLLNYNWQKGIDTKVFYNMGTLVCNQREALVDAARSWAATHILWLDSDMSFPFYTAYKLLDHAQPIVGANYVTRALPYKTVAYKTLGGDWTDYLTHTKDQPLTKELIEVEGMGMGCMLTDITVFDSQPAPWFEIKWQADSKDYLGEDINFCTRAKAGGYKIWVDDILSRQISHLGTFAFGHDLVQNADR